MIDDLIVLIVSLQFMPCIVLPKLFEIAPANRNHAHNRAQRKQLMLCNRAHVEPILSLNSTFNLDARHRTLYTRDCCSPSALVRYIIYYFISKSM